MADLSRREFAALAVAAPFASARTLSGAPPKKNSYLSALFRRIARTRGTRRATMAVGHAILVIAFHLLQRKTTYVDLGPDYFDRRNTDAVRRSLVRRLQKLGHSVTLAPAPVFS